MLTHEPLTMKTLFLLILVARFATAQEPLTFSQVVEVPDATQRDLFGKGKLWVADVFRNSKAVIDAEDEASGQLLAKPAFRYSSTLPAFSGPSTVGGIVTYKLRLQVKDGKYRHELTDFVHELFGPITVGEEQNIKLFGATKGYKARVWKDIQEQCQKEADTIGRSLRKAMTSSNDF